MADLSSNVKWTIWWTFTMICWICLTPVLCYWTYRFSKYKNNLIVQKRHQKIAILIAIFSIFVVCVERPLYLLRYTLNAETIKVTDTNIPTFTLIIYYIQEVLGDTIIPNAWLLTLRYWLIHFNVKWTKNTIDSKWKIHLNADQVKKNWYLKNKSTYGNLSWILKRLMIIISILISIHLTMEILFPKGFVFATLVSFLLIITPMIIPYILYIKMRKFQDKFYIMQEFRNITINIFVGTVAYLLIGMSPSFGVSAFLRAVMVACLRVIMNTSSLAIQLWWVMHIINKDNKILLSWNTERELSIDSVASTSKSDIQNHIVQMQTILKDENSFEQFMQHLSKEWSMELLVALIEISQMQSVMKTYFNIESSNDDTMKLLSVQDSLLQNESIPESYVVYHKSVKGLLEEYDIYVTSKDEHFTEDKINEFKIKLFVLYKKYIVSGSELQINLSYEQKSRLDSLMSNVNYFINNVNIAQDELFSLYHDVNMELVKLLTHSYYRFVT
eukprot:481708_1